MAYECPSCGWPLYNRRRATCELRGGAVLWRRVWLDPGDPGESGE